MDKIIKFFIDKQYSRIPFYIDRFKVTYGIRLRSVVDTVSRVTVRLGLSVKMAGASLCAGVAKFVARFALVFRGICNDVSKICVSLKMGTVIGTIANHRSSIKVRCVRPRTLGDMSVMTLGDMSAMTLSELIAVDI